jgi:hypothetical protein
MFQPPTPEEMALFDEPLVADVGCGETDLLRETP